MTYLALFISVFLISWLGVSVFIKWAPGRSMLDIPNERSSHDEPTPVGGGVVIVFLCLALLVIYELISGRGIRFWAYLIGGLAIAVVSWIDDIRRLPVLLRFGVHTLAASLTVWGVGGFEIFSYSATGNVFVPGVFLGGLISVVWIVWLTNAYNFMDGIDGLAATQAVVAAGCWAIIGWTNGIEAVVVISILIFASSLGFLIHNWAPARVFMGDIGSAFLGYTFAVLPLIALNLSSDSRLNQFLPIMAVAIVWPFVADTVMTFIGRLLRGDRVWKAHRKHFYQRLIKSGLSHSKVVLIYTGFMLFAGTSIFLEGFVSFVPLTILVCLVLAPVIALTVKVQKG